MPPHIFCTALFRSRCGLQFNKIALSHRALAPADSCPSHILSGHHARPPPAPEHSPNLGDVAIGTAATAATAAAACTTGAAAVIEPPLELPIACSSSSSIFSITIMAFILGAGWYLRFLAEIVIIRVAVVAVVTSKANGRHALGTPCLLLVSASSCENTWVRQNRWVSASHDCLPNQSRSRGSFRVGGGLFRVSSLSINE